jgi:hypothetical protein
MTNPTPTQKTRSSVECPACSSREARATLADLSVYVCGRCGCLHGTTYLGSSYSFILPRMTSSVEGVAEFPYDLRTLGSAGVSRRHGFYQPSTKLVTQVG